MSTENNNEQFVIDQAKKMATYLVESSQKYIARYPEWQESASAIVNWMASQHQEQPQARGFEALGENLQMAIETPKQHDQLTVALKFLFRVDQLVEELQDGGLKRSLHARGRLKEGYTAVFRLFFSQAKIHSMTIESSKAKKCSAMQHILRQLAEDLRVRLGD